jgi:microcystin degradation protein MlrC
VALDLHGAGVAAGAGAEDLEGAVIAAVRELVGAQIPIVVCGPPERLTL